MICLLHSMQLAGWVAASREKGSHNPIDECCREDLLSMKSCRIFPHVLDHCGKIVAKFNEPSHPLTIWIVWTLTSLNLLYNLDQKRPSTCATTFRNDRFPPKPSNLFTSTANSFHKKCHEQLQPTPSKKGIWSLRKGYTDIHFGLGRIGSPWFKASCRWHPSRICGWRLRHSIISILHLPEKMLGFFMAFFFLEHMIEHEFHRQKPEVDFSKSVSIVDISLE